MIKKKKLDVVEDTTSIVVEDSAEAQAETAKQIKEETVASGKEQTSLTDIEDYIKTSSYLGTKVITPGMRKYVYRRRMDGLAILNTLIVDKKLADAINFVKQYDPKDWVLICKREAGWRAVKMFSELTGVRIFTKKYPAGIITNTQLPDFFETKMIMICDPWLDKNALSDAKNIRIPVVGICNTNNNTFHIDMLIIGNNHSNKSLGLFFWLLAREYLKAHKIDKKLPSLEDFVGEKLILEEPKKKRKEKIKEDKLKEAETSIEERFKKLAEQEAEGKSTSSGEGAEHGV
ncbi:30S ribosomal protein S2 [Candidatus Pacearchaeota archaeon]|nr:30S ribosomal protein S2 [Candidatus Pacearchaeota archaeon]